MGFWWWERSAPKTAIRMIKAGKMLLEEKPDNAVSIISHTIEYKGAVKNGVGKLRISQPFALQKTVSETSVFGAALRQPGVCLVKELTHVG